MPDKVSILIPTYNRAGYLYSAIRSALAQTHNNVEVIVLDDASPDATAATVASFSDTRLLYIRHKNNIGIAGNWQAGIEATTGDFFCLLHDDDTLEPDFLRRLLLPLLEDENLAVSFCDHWTMDAQGERQFQASDDTSRKFKRDRLAPGKLENFAECALVDASVPVGASMFRRSVVLPSFIQEDAKGGIDLWLFYQIVRSGYGAYYLQERLMNYRWHNDGMSGSMPVYMRDGHIFRYRHILADKQLADLHATTRQSLTAGLLDQGKALIVRGRRREARALLREALGYSFVLGAVVVYGLACMGELGTTLAIAMRNRQNTDGYTSA